MRVFVCKIILFLGISTVPLFGLFIFSGRDGYRNKVTHITRSEGYDMGDNAGSREIIPYINSMRMNPGYTKLILGDSVCHQIYNRFQDDNDDFCISGTNRAITLAGQYLLAREFVEHHENVTDIYLVVILGGLAADFDTRYGYQYVVMPFTETDTIGYLDESTRERLYRTYGRIFCQKRVVQWIDRSPWNRKWYLNLLAEGKIPGWSTGKPEADSLISLTAYEYLEKMEQMCEEKGIVFHLIPGPLADEQSLHQEAEQMAAEAERFGKQEQFGDYFSQIHYYPAEWFGDGVHFDEDVVGEAFFREIAAQGDLQELKTGTD